jgi:HK97 family phage prohead protease
MATHEIERRTTFSDASIEFRDAGDGEKRPTIVGYASVFNSESRNLGGFIETVHPRAFDDVLSSNPDVLGLYNHDKNKLLARSSNGSLKLSVDPRGLRYEMSLPATRDAEDVAIMVKEGLVTGSSFAFAVRKNGGDVWSTDDRGMKRREIRSVGLLEDVGPVVRPAYDASSVVVSRRAIEMALGENFRPNQTMANAARRGLRVAEKRDDVDQRLLMIAERLVNREVVSVEEVSYLSEVHQRAAAARAADWTGSPAHAEWLLAGGESGQKWVERRTAAQDEPAAISVASISGEASDEEADHRAEGDVSLKPTAGMAAACRRGLKLYEDGRGGDGLVPATISWARKIAARESLTKEKVVKMRAWHARHKVDKKPGWDKPGEETPGFVAFLLWAGAPGARWSAAKVAQMERGEQRDVLGKDAAEVEEEYGTLSPANLAYVESLEGVVDEHGPWPQEGPAGAHYIEISPFAERGMKCSNCVFFEAGACEVVQGSISEDGICKLWVIPEEKMSEESKRSEAAVVEESTQGATPEEDAGVATAESEPHDDALAAKVKLAELNAVLLRTRLQSSSAVR